MDTYQLHPLALQKIKQEVEPGSTIIELGSGRGTENLAKDYVVYTVEHDKQWAIYKSHPKIKQVHAPIVFGWYENDKIGGWLPESYDLIIIDGPPGEIGRAGILKHLDLFNWDAAVLIDDVNRSPEMALASQIAAHVGRKPQFFHLPDGRAYAWIPKKPINP